MSVTTTQFIKKPLIVDAVRITGANFEEIATWCQGEILRDEVPGKGTGKKYIKVRVHNPKNPRQSKAFVGDWLLYTDRGYKVYTNKAFHMSFDEAETVDEPKGDSDFVAVGPECFALKDGSVLSWKGTNYVPQAEKILEESSEEDAVTLEQQRGEGLVGPEEEIEIVPATPENIAQAVLENEAARKAEEDKAA